MAVLMAAAAAVRCVHMVGMVMVLVVGTMAVIVPMVMRAMRHAALLRCRVRVIVLCGCSLFLASGFARSCQGLFMQA
jgi:hypothetical protein